MNLTDCYNIELHPGDKVAMKDGDGTTYEIATVLEHLLSNNLVLINPEDAEKPIFATASNCYIDPPPGQAPPPVAPVIGQFTADPVSVAAGLTSVLAWSVTGADEVSIDNGVGVVGATGNVVVTPLASTDYTLTASNLSGPVTAVASVAVDEPVADPASAQASQRSSLLPKKK